MLSGKTSAGSVSKDGDPLYPNQIAAWLAGQQANTAANPYLVTIAGSVDISTSWADINNAVASPEALGRYATIDISLCPDYAIAGEFVPSGNDFNIIQGNEFIVGVVLPGELETIGDDSFTGCAFLISVSMPDTVTSIGERAFYKCISLTDAAMPDSVLTIGESAFFGCTGLTSLDIPPGVTDLLDNTFKICSGLTSLTVPGTVANIGGHTSSDLGSVFAMCSSLVCVTIEEGVETVGFTAFDACTSLVSVSIPESVTGVYKQAFRGCPALTTVTFGRNDTKIPSTNAFPYGDSLVTAYAAGGAGTYTLDADTKTWTKQ